MGSIKLEANVTCLSWNPDSHRLLFGLQNKSLQIWSYNTEALHSPQTLDFNLTSTCTSSTSTSCSSAASLHTKKATPIRTVPEEADEHSATVKFSITTDYDHEPLIQPHVAQEKKKPLEPIFKKVWEKLLSSPIKCLKYSPDGLLFATFGEVNFNKLF